MFDEKSFLRDPREYALLLAECGLVSEGFLLSCALKYMSYDEVRGMLKANELDPRFMETK